MGVNYDVFPTENIDDGIEYTYTLDELVEMGKIQPNTNLDNSNVFAQYGGSGVGFGNCSIMKVDTEKKITFDTLGSNTSQSGSRLVSTTSTYNSFVTSITSNLYGYNIEFQDSLLLSSLALVNKINYNEYVLLVRIEVCNLSAQYPLPYNHTREIYLNDYNETLKAEYPYITKVEIIPYYRENGSTNRSSTTVTPLIEIKDRQYYRMINNRNIFTRAYTTIDKTGSSGNTSNTTCIYPFATDTIENHININVGNYEEISYITYTTTINLESVYQLVASLGFYFTGDYNTAKAGGTGKLSSELMYLPIINAGGFTTGDYIQGEEISDLAELNPNSNANWGGDALDKAQHSDFYDSNDYVFDIPLINPNINAMGCFNKCYAISKNNVKAFNDFLWNCDETALDTMVAGLKLMGNNPITAITNLRMYPFDILSITSGTPRSIFMGKVDSEITGFELSSNVNAILDMGKCELPPKYNNFLDFEPYTEVSLYIPFCNVVKISASEFYKATISVKIIVDIITGVCVGVVYKNDIPMLYTNGVMGVDIMVTGDNASQQSSNITSSIIGTLGSAATGNIGGTISGLSGVFTGANSSSVQKSGSNTPYTSFYQPRNCYAIFKRPKTVIPNNYSHSVGITCDYTAKLGNLNGFTICKNVDVKTTATANENAEIKELLEGGVYL